MALLQGVGTVKEPWVAIIDASIDVAVQKVLVILRVPVAALQARGSAVTLQDAECIGISIADTWTGESVSRFLQETFERSGDPVAIIKDGGSDLNKGVNLLNAARKITIPVIEDLGHFAANALKAQYSTLLTFKNFLALICKAAAKLRQSDLAFLTPPKLRSKGRFQNITKLANWAALILPLLGAPGRVSSLSLAARLRAFIPRLACYRIFLEAFSKTCHIVSEFLALMKNKGLNRATYFIALAKLQELPEDSVVRKRLLGWLERQIKTQASLKIGDTPLLVSSDIIESLFGKFKLLVARNPKAEFNRIVLSIVTLCGNPSGEAISMALRDVKQSDLDHWTEKNIKTSQCQLRRAFYRGKLHPNMSSKAGEILFAESG